MAFANFVSATGINILQYISFHTVTEKTNQEKEKRLRKKSTWKNKTN